jgi:HEAT repeat protein
LRIERERAVDFVGWFTESESEESREQAALALGASRLPEAIDFLKRRWNDSSLVSRSAILNGLSVSRLDSAIDFLLGILKTGRVREALEALTALEIHRDSTEILQLIEATVCNRAEPEIRSHFERYFGRRD